MISWIKKMFKREYPEVYVPIPTPPPMPEVGEMYIVSTYKTKSPWGVDPNDITVVIELKDGWVKYRFKFGVIMTKPIDDFLRIYHKV